MILYHDIPSSKGVENVLKRARQMAELEWTPVRPCPAGRSLIEPTGKRYVDCYHPAWLPQKGVNYSSVRKYEKFVGFNVSHETYLSALINPRSVMYTKPQHGVGLRMFSYYGIVCSAFVSYCCGLPLRLPCSRWPYDPHVSEVDPSDLRDLRLCDIVLDVKKHIAIITDIERDVEGNVAYITVSESKLPVVSVTRFTAEGFRGYWLEDDYKIYRRDDLDGVTYEPSPFVRLEGDPLLPVPELNRTLQPDLGNKANYMLGEPVELDVLTGDWNAIAVSGPETLKLPVEDGKAVFTPQKTGFYTAWCENGAERSAPVEFCVTAITAELDRTVCGKEEVLNVIFSAPAEDEPIGWIVQNRIWQYRAGSGFTAEEKQNRRFTVSAVGSAARKEMVPGEYQLIVLVKNKYGIYKSEFLDFTVE